MTPTGRKYIPLDYMGSSWSYKVGCFLCWPQNQKFYLGFFFQPCLAPWLGNDLHQVNTTKRHVQLKVYQHTFILAFKNSMVMPEKHIYQLFPKILHSSCLFFHQDILHKRKVRCFPGPSHQWSQISMWHLMLSSFLHVCKPQTFLLCT